MRTPKSATTQFDSGCFDERRDELAGGQASCVRRSRTWGSSADLGFLGDKYAHVLARGAASRRTLELREDCAGVSARSTAVTMANQIVGAGLLALPYAMRQAGMSFALVLAGVALLMGFTMWLTGHLLHLVDHVADDMGIPRDSRDWSLLGKLAFGDRGRKLFALCCVVDLYGGVVAFLIMTGANLQILLPSVPMPALIASAGALVFALLFAPEEYFGVFAAVGLAAQLLIMCCLVMTGMELEARGAAATDQVLLDVEGVPAALGIAIFLFVAHSEAPLLYQMMEDRAEWPWAVAAGFAGSLAVFLAVGCLGYAFFGGATQQAFTANLGRDLELALLPGGLNPLFSCACAGLISCKLIVSTPFTAAPILTFVEESAKLRYSPRLRVISKALFMAITTALCVLLKDRVAFVMEICGCVVQNAICITLPCLATLQLQEDLRGTSKCALITVAMMSIVYMCVGLQSLVA